MGSDCISSWALLTFLLIIIIITIKSVLEAYVHSYFSSTKITQILRVYQEEFLWRQGTAVETI